MKLVYVPISLMNYQVNQDVKKEQLYFVPEWQGKIWSVETFFDISLL